MRSLFTLLVMLAIASGAVEMVSAQGDAARIGPVRTLVSAQRLRAMQLPIFPDGSLFAFRIGNHTRFFAAECGARTATDAGSVELNGTLEPA